ncbi:MAG: hypothetical protein ABUL44_02895 [Flavobacterium sp.]
MLAEINTDSSERYLLCNRFIPDKIIKRIKDDLKSFWADRQKDELYFEFINWQKKSNEIALLTLYAYADIIFLKKFDTIFQIDNPNNYTTTEFLIKHIVMDSRVALNEIAHGHKHILILEFSNAVPSIFNLLSEFKENEWLDNKIELGICSNVDFDAIKINLNRP